MSVLNTTDWVLISLVIVCIGNFLMVSQAHYKLRNYKSKTQSQKRRIHELEQDVRALYESATTVGNKLHSLDQRSRMLKEQQEQLTLKEPNQQTYRNAINAIRNGDSVSEISDSSGLSRGEVELLTLLQKINSNAAEKQAN